MPDVDYYAVLGIERTASTDEVKAAYRRAVKAAHPDHGGTEGLFVLIQEAGNHLLDPSARAAYDTGGGGIELATVDDPWAGNWSDTSMHSPAAPPSFAQPWWTQPVEPIAKSASAKTSRRQRSLIDHGIRQIEAPPPIGVLIARLAVFGFALMYLALRVLAATPRSQQLIDRLGLLWTLFPLIGLIGGVWALRAIRHDPLRFGGERTAWIWTLLNAACFVGILTVGTAVLYDAI